MAEPKSKLLIVEDDLDIADMLNAYFRVQGYDVLTVNWGEDGVRACQTNMPDLVILDIRLPDIDGFEVARRLRTNRRTKQIPIIFLTEKRERNDRLKGLELHAEDYITKPFDIQELRLRVRNALASAKRGSLTNPVTGLPDGDLVTERLSQTLQDADAVAMVVALGNLDRFREVYGFVASDDLLRAVSLMLQGSLRDNGGTEDFLGHIGTDTFLVITRRPYVAALKENIRRQLQQSFDYFYRDQDREMGLFREQGLTVYIQDLDVAQQGFSEVSQLRARLEALRP
ncbi:MAG: response regulator [Anaerolinea sp.]|nr:response regulator [Anaerolinea sp.]